MKKENNIVAPVRALAPVFAAVVALTPASFVAAKNPPVKQKTIAAAAAAGVSVTPPGTSDADEVKKLLAMAPDAAQYPNAAKVTLYDLSDIVVRPDGSARTVTRQTLKVFNKRGRDQEAEVKIPYNSTYDTVRIIRARTIEPDGRVVPVDMADIRDQTVNEDGVYTDARQKSFSMPAVDDGSIIDYEYVLDQKESQMAGQFWTKWYFQSGLDPVKLTRLTITAPKTFVLNQKIRNSTVKPLTKDLPDGKNRLYTWEDRDVAPLEPEPMMPEVDRILPMMQISTIASWQSIADWYTRLAKDRMVADKSVKDLVADITRGKTTPEEKAKAIFYYVEEKTRYVSIDFGISAYQPHHAAAVCANKYGDCKDMATLLVTMLREVGVDAYPVLLDATSKVKKSEEMPSPGAFDHAICLAEIDGKQYWLDATAQVCAWGQIPGGDRGAEAFVIRDGKGVFETIPTGTPDDNLTNQSVKLTLNPDGSASGTVTLSGTGDADMGLRAAFAYLPPDKLRPYLESIAQNIGPDPRVSDIHVDSADKNKPVTVTMSVAFPAWANQSDEMLIFKARAEQSKGESSSPFREDGRHLSIAQPSSALAVSMLEINLPPGYSVLSKPKDSDIKSDLGRFYRSTTVDGNKLTILMRGENYRADIPAFRYDDVRRYYAQYLKAFNQSVIVKKN